MSSGIGMTRLVPPRAHVAASVNVNENVLNVCWVSSQPATELQPPSLGGQPGLKMTIHVKSSETGGYIRKTAPESDEVVHFAAMEFGLPYITAGGIFIISAALETAEGIEGDTYRMSYPAKFAVWNDLASSPYKWTEPRVFIDAPLCRYSSITKFGGQVADERNHYECHIVICTVAETNGEAKVHMKAVVDKDGTTWEARLGEQALADGAPVGFASLITQRHLVFWLGRQPVESPMLKGYFNNAGDVINWIPDQAIQSYSPYSRKGGSIAVAGTGYENYQWRETQHRLDVYWCENQSSIIWKTLKGDKGWLNFERIAIPGIINHDDQLQPTRLVAAQDKRLRSTDVYWVTHDGQVQGHTESLEPNQVLKGCYSIWRGAENLKSRADPNSSILCLTEPNIMLSDARPTRLFWITPKGGIETAVRVTENGRNWKVTAISGPGTARTEGGIAGIYTGLWRDNEKDGIRLWWFGPSGELISANWDSDSVNRGNTHGRPWAFYQQLPPGSARPQANGRMDLAAGVIDGWLRLWYIGRENKIMQQMQMYYE